MSAAQPVYPMATPMAVQYVYVPIVQYQPMFAHVVPVSSINGVPADIAGIIQASRTLTVRQHVKLFPKSCCTCPPCVKQENTYSVYAGIGENMQAEFLRVDEVSDDWNRCCCAPYHPLRLEVRQYIPGPDEVGNSEFANVMNDMKNSWGTLNSRDKAAGMTNMYKHYPPLFSFVRGDGQRCCYKCPCKCLSTFVCCSCCQDSMQVFSGQLADDPNGEKGRPFNLPQDRLLGSIIQPNFGGCCLPTLHLFEPNATQAYSKIQGPCLFGGMSEYCCSYRFFVSAFDSPSKTGDLGVIVKKKPESLVAAVKETMSDADNYTIEFNTNANLNAAQKVNILAAQIFADYMYFDGNTEKCKRDDNGCTIYCCYCSVLGAIVPCCVHIPTKSS